MTTREALYALIDSLPEGMVEPALRSITELRDDPWAWALKYAPVDDEEYSDDDRAASQRAAESSGRGEVLSTAQVDARLSR